MTLASLESYDYPIIRKSDAKAAEDFCTGILNAELFYPPYSYQNSLNGEGT